MPERSDPIWRALGVLFTSHPWHGVSLGPRSPSVVTCFVEVVPTDTMKYEIDKTTGLLRLDRPQRFSNVSPSPYGFLPQTLCAERVAAFSNEKTGTPHEGDGDPLDVCVLTEKPLAHGNLLVEAIPIGGLRMIDGAEVDDKIVAVLEGDSLYGRMTDVSDCPKDVLDRLRHYFLTYKLAPGAETRPCEITHVYGRDEAHEVIVRSQADYASRFGGLDELLTAALRG